MLVLICINLTLFWILMFLTVSVYLFKYRVLLLNVIAVFNTLHSEALDDFSTFKLLSHTQERCRRAAEANKLDFNIFKRKCDNVCYVSAAAHEWSLLPNNVTSCNSFYHFINCAKSFIAECIRKTSGTHCRHF